MKGAWEPKVSQVAKMSDLRHLSPGLKAFSVVESRQGGVGGTYLLGDGDKVGGVAVALAAGAGAAVLVEVGRDAVVGYVAFVHGGGAGEAEDGRKSRDAEELHICECWRCGSTVSVCL